MMTRRGFQWGAVFLAAIGIGICRLAVSPAAAQEADPFREATPPAASTPGADPFRIAPEDAAPKPVTKPAPAPEPVVAAPPPVATTAWDGTWTGQWTNAGQPSPSIIVISGGAISQFTDTGKPVPCQVFSIGQNMVSFGSGDFSINLVRISEHQARADYLGSYGQRRSAIFSSQ